MTSSDRTFPDGNLPIIQAVPQLLLLTTIFFTTFMARIILAPLLPAMQAELAMNHRGAGNLFFRHKKKFFFR